MASVCVEDVLSSESHYLNVVSRCGKSLTQDSVVTRGTTFIFLEDTSQSKGSTTGNALVKGGTTVIDPDTLPVGVLAQRSVTVTESELLDSDCETTIVDCSPTTVSPRKAYCNNVIRDAFHSAQSQWIQDPVIDKWRHPDHRIHKVLTDLEHLHFEWKSLRIWPFNLITDRVWLEVGRVLADVGLPWHNNQINMPDEIDTSWPFHFKPFETQVIRAKGSRVADANPSGYVCNWGEANCYGIRALQQELREKYPARKPLLVHDEIEQEIVQSAEKLLGLELYQVDLSQDISCVLQQLTTITLDGTRPIIFAATLANYSGQHDDIEAVCKISQVLPTILHVDASRNFDYITTMLDDDRQRLGIPRLCLGMTNLESSLLQPDGAVLASTIVAGGANHTAPAPVVALKPLALGSTSVKVACTRASDSTLAGSRDAIAPLWVALQELRFGEDGFRQVYQYCARMRESLTRALRSREIEISVPAYSLDILVKRPSRWQIESLVGLGGTCTKDGDLLLTVQPSVKSEDLLSIMTALLPQDQDLTTVEADLREAEENFGHAFPISPKIVDDLRSTVRSWKVATRSAAGYPFHMGSYSALGPVVGAFLDVAIPDDWIQARAREVINSRLKSFGLTEVGDRSKFKGAFTNGSTMGNRVGINTALAHFPGAHLYFSSETHYSVPKTARDCDDLTNRWSDRARRYSEIPCEANGSICPKSLVQQAAADRAECQRLGMSYNMVLFLNMGTTFVGARDNLKEIREHLAAVDIEIAYIHLDGALDFGFHDCGVVLGAPGVSEVDGVPVVQGVTLSHHKAMGNMVSGEVLCYSPGKELATLASGVDPRAVFETWLYLQVYSETDLIEMFNYCKANASRLETGLKRIGVVTKRNQDSTIVVLERPPAWITEEFSLRPQEDWVHFITMPHVSTDAVDLFIHRIEWVDQQCQTAFRYVSGSLASAMSKPLRLQRVQCCSSMAEKVADMAQALVQPTKKYFESIDGAIKASLRGAMSVVAVNDHGEPEVVFLAESTRTRTIRAGPVLAGAQYSQSKTMIVDVMQQLIGLIGRHLYAAIETDELSYRFLPLP